MKKITIGFLLLFAMCIVTKAQDVKKARTFFTLAQIPGATPQKIEDAKVEIDKLAADPKTQNTPEALALRAELYGIIAGNQTLSAKYPNADVDALDALQKYLQADTSAKILQADRFAGVNATYASLFNSGVRLYNEKKWDSSFNKFKRVIELSDIGISKKWFSTAFDTTAYLYAGVTAQNSKDEANAVKYYSALASRKMKGKDYEGVYEYLTKYYLNNKNEAEFNKSIALAKEVYPENTLWKDLDFYYQTKNAEPADMLKRFNADDAAGTLTSLNYFDYGNIFVNDKRIRDLDDAKRNDYTNRSVYAFEKSFEKDTTNALASYNAGVTLYSNWQDLSEAARAIKGTTADIKTKRAAADKLADAAADKASEWLEKAFWGLVSKKSKGTLSSLEKGCLNKSTDLLYNVYAYKLDRSRGNNPKDFDKYDAKTKFYDSLHGKL